MPKYEIKTVITGADQAAKELSKPAKGIDEITAKLKAMDQAEQNALKTQRVHGDESEQMASHLSKLTKEAKEQGQQVSTVVGIKGRWLGAIKALKNEIPGLGYAVAAIKNPFVALTAVIAIALNRLSAWNDEMQRLSTAVGDVKISDAFNNIGAILARGKNDIKQINDELDRIANRQPTIEEAGQQAIANFDRQLRIEEAGDPEGKGKASRAQRRLDFIAGTAASQALRAREELRSGRAALPGERNRLSQAEIARDRSLGIADAHERSAAATLAEVGPLIAAIEKPGLFPSIDRQFRFGTPAERDATLAELKAAQEGAMNLRQQAGTIRENALATFGAAEGRFNQFNAGLHGSGEQARSFGAATLASVADAAAMRPINDPNAAQLAAATRRAQASLDSFIRSMELMWNDAQRKIDAMSRRAASQSQDTR